MNQHRRTFSRWISALFIGFLLSVSMVAASTAQVDLIPTDLDSAAPIDPAQTESQIIFLPSIANGMAASAPAPTPTPAPTPDDELSPEERFIAIQAIGQTIEATLPSPDTPAEQRDLVAEIQQLGTALLSAPNVVTTVVQTGTLTVHAILSDGLSIAIINNRPPETTLAQRETALKHYDSILAESNRSVPGSPNAVVTFFDGGGSVAAEVRSMLNEAGYNVLGLGPSIGAMRNYKNLGALYLDTHGASFLTVDGFKEDEDGKKSPNITGSVFSLQSSTDVSVESLASSYVDELRSGEVVVNFVQRGDSWYAKLGITEKFIAKHWTFDDAIVMIHACFGGAGPFMPGSDCKGSCSASEAGVFDPTPLRQAMLAAGAKAVVSFDNYTNTDVARTNILHFWDRMSGVNRVSKVNPPLRAFALDQVWGDMADRDLLSFTKPSYIFAGFGFGGNNVNLTVDSTEPAAGLVPSIRMVDVIDDASAEMGKLEIFGTFGAREGIVTLGGLAATVKSWTNDKIVVETPFSGNGAAGDLIVEAPGSVESNPVPITEWRGIVTVTFIPGRGTLQARTELDVRFRADLHKFRTNISDTPDDRTVDVYVSGASTGNIKASGIFVEEDGQTTYHDGGELDMFGKNVIDVFAGFSSGAADLAVTETSGQFGGLITLNPKSNRASLCLVMQSIHPVTIQTEGISGESIGVILLPGPEGVQDRLRGGLSCVDVPFQNYTLSSGTRTVTIDEATYKLEWTSFQPVAAPTEQTPG